MGKRYVVFCLSWLFLSTVSPVMAAKKKPVETAPQEDKTYEQLKLILDVYQQVLENYVDEVDSQSLTYGAATGLVATLDPFSQFLAPEAREEIQTLTEGQFGGLGIRVMVKEGWLTVITPLPDSPAYKAGVLPEDRIVMIEAESTQNMTLNDAIKKLRGAPKTKVSISVVREGEKEPLVFNIVRESIQIASVRSRLLMDNVGYIRIMEFIEPTSRDLRSALESLTKQGMKSLVLDLRNNPGGLLSSAVDVCKEFIGDQKLIVYTQGRAQPRQDFKADKEAPYRKLPLAVLVNKGSASGSEIVAGAVQDWNRGLIIGAETFGKGSVQSVINIDEKTGLRLTTAKYFTPKGRSIHRDPKTGKGGVQPDIAIAVDRDTEMKLQAQSEEIYAKGKTSYSAVAEKDQVRDEVLEKAMTALTEGRKK